MKVTDTYQNETVKGLPTPFDLAGDSRWDEGGELLKLYDLELEKRTAVRSVLGAEEVFTGVNPVFTPVINTVKEDEMVDMIEYWGDEPDGVKVFTQIPGGEGNIFEKAPKPEPGNGHGNGEGVIDPDGSIAGVKPALLTNFRSQPF